MTTFQAIIYALIEGICRFLPLSPEAHRTFIPYFLNWQPPTGVMLGALTLGSFLALFIYFRHDWASIISSFLQVILFRKRPMTLDERLPLFLGVTLFPVAVCHSYFHPRFEAMDWPPALIACTFAAIGLPLWFFDHLSKKSKGMFDWNWMDATWVGVIEASAFIPGWDYVSSAMLGALFLNYRRESAAKYAYYSLTPLLLIQSISYLKEINFHSPSPMPDVSWLSFGVTIVVACLAGLIAIGGFMKHLQQKGVGQYVVYRWVLAAGVCGFYWLKSHS